jgi:hypothetical protein
MPGFGTGIASKYTTEKSKMAWPDKLDFIRSELNTSELWVLKERMADDSNWLVVESSTFAEFGEFVVEFNSGERYQFTEVFELIDSVKKL